MKRSKVNESIEPIKIEKRLKTTNSLLIKDIWFEVKRVYNLTNRNIIQAYDSPSTFIEIDNFYNSCEKKCQYVFLSHVDRSDEKLKKLLQNYKSLASHNIILVFLTILHSDDVLEEMTMNLQQRYVNGQIFEMYNRPLEENYTPEEEAANEEEGENDDLEKEYVNLLREYEIKNNNILIEESESSEDENDDFAENFLIHCNNYKGKKKTLFYFFQKLICYIRPLYIVNNIGFHLHKSFKFVDKSFVYNKLE